MSIACGPSTAVDFEKMGKTFSAARLAGHTANDPAKLPRSRISRIPIPISIAGSARCEQLVSKTSVPSSLFYHVTKTEKSQYSPLRVVIGGRDGGYSLEPPVESGSSVSGPSSSSLYGTAKSNPSVTRDSNASDPGLGTSIVLATDSAQVECISSTQSQLYNDITNLCISESSTCPQGCDRDDCPRAGLGGVDCSSTVTCEDDGEDR